MSRIFLVLGLMCTTAFIALVATKPEATITAIVFFAGLASYVIAFLFYIGE